MGLLKSAAVKLTPLLLSSVESFLAIATPLCEFEKSVVQVNQKNL